MSNVLSELDENQKLCLRLVAVGYTSKQIAQRTHLSAGTVDQYIFRANAVLGVADRREAARLLAAAELSHQLKQSQLKSGGLAGGTESALMDGQGEPLPDHIARTTKEYPERPASGERAADEDTTLLDRALAVVGGEPHGLNFRQKLMATSWVALATGGTLSALIAVGYWLNHLMN